MGSTVSRRVDVNDPRLKHCRHPMRLTTNSSSTSTATTTLSNGAMFCSAPASPRSGMRRKSAAYTGNSVAVAGGVSSSSSSSSTTNTTSGSGSSTPHTIDVSRIRRVSIKSSSTDTDDLLLSGAAVGVGVGQTSDLLVSTAPHPTRPPSSGVSPQPSSSSGFTRHERSVSMSLGASPEKRLSSVNRTKTLEALADEYLRNKLVMDRFSSAGAGTAASSELSSAASSPPVSISPPILGNSSRQLLQLRSCSRRSSQRSLNVVTHTSPSPPSSSSSSGAASSAQMDDNTAQDVPQKESSSSALLKPNAASQRMTLMGLQDGYYTPEEARLYETAAQDQSVGDASSGSSSPEIRWQRANLIGTGAFGKVYLGMNLDNGQLLAVKQIPFLNHNEMSKEIGDFKQEVSVLKCLKHENIVQYLGMSVENDYLNIFFEYIPSGSLDSLLKKFGSFNEGVIKCYTRQVLLGLQYLHDHLIVHRDVKGANILVDNNGTLKLTDFGASKKLEEMVTSCGVSIKGTANWMAPEVIKQNGYGRQSDIWSLGCTVIEMATGKPPWTGISTGAGPNGAQGGGEYNPISMLFLIANADRPPPLPQDRLSPEGLDFLTLCLKMNPKERPNARRLLLHSWLIDTKKTLSDSQRSQLCRQSAVVMASGSSSAYSSGNTSSSCCNNNSASTEPGPTSALSSGSSSPGMASPSTVSRKNSVETPSTCSRIRLASAGLRKQQQQQQSQIQQPDGLMITGSRVVSRESSSHVIQPPPQHQVSEDTIRRFLRENTLHDCEQKSRVLAHNNPSIFTAGTGALPPLPQSPPPPPPQSILHASASSASLLALAGDVAPSVVNIPPPPTGTSFATPPQPPPSSSSSSSSLLPKSSSRRWKEWEIALQHQLVQSAHHL